MGLTAMVVETLEWKVMTLIALHMLAGLAIALLIDGGSLAVLGSLLFLASLSGAIHATRLLRSEMRDAHIELANAVAIVHRTRGLNLSPTKFSEELSRCVTQRLAGKQFKMVSVRMNVW